jgi:hAT family C-terminal dimerisation region
VTTSSLFSEDFNLHHFQFVNSLPVEMKDMHEGIQAVRMSCFIHTLQLTIRDGLQKVSHVQKILEKCQTLARSAQKSSQIADILEQINRHIERPTVTRWNSELMLIKSILHIGKEHIESVSNSVADSIRFSNHDFCMMKEIVDVLEPFHQVSIKCQAEKLVTISLVVPSIVHLVCHLRSVKDSLSFCHQLVQQLQSSMETRFAGIINRLNHVPVQDDDPFNDPLYFMTTLLDPTFKFFWIRDLQLAVNIENRLKQNIIQLVLDEISKDSLTELATAQKTPPTAASTTSEVKRRKLFFYDNYVASDDNSNEQKPLHPSVEIEAYLNDPVRSKFSDYWQRSRLTSLKTLVARIFSVQASSAPIERVFSHAGLILSSRRMRINEQLFKDIVFLKANQSLL